MTNANLIAMLGNLGDGETRCELSDWAVNTIREYAREQGWTRDDTDTMAGEEIWRIESGKLDLAEYLAVSRAGSRFRLDRRIRRAVFAVYATRYAA